MTENQKVFLKLAIEYAGRIVVKLEELEEHSNKKIYQEVESALRHLLRKKIIYDGERLERVRAIHETNNKIKYQYGGSTVRMLMNTLYMHLENFLNDDVLDRNFLEDLQSL